MRRVLTAVVLIPLVLLAVFKAPLWLFALLVLAVALLATDEYLKLAQHSGAVPFVRLTQLAMIVFFLAIAGRPVLDEIWMRSARFGEHPSNAALLHARESLVILWLVLLSSPAWFLLRGMQWRDFRAVLGGAGASLLSLFYIGLPLVGMISIRSQSDGAVLLLYMFLVVWCGDIAAYYAGRAFGKHKLAPRISPGKTWEGALASVVASAIVGTLILVYGDGFRSFLFSIRLAHAPSVFPMSGTIWWMALPCSVGVNIAAQLGDLVESMLKRGAGVKDSGTLVPGHGGVLDRIDALLFATPLVWYYSIFRLLNV